MNDKDIREHVDGIFAGDDDEVRESVDDLLQNARRKTAEINLLVREIRAKNEALGRIARSISLREAGPGVLVHSFRQLRDIAQKALDWRPSHDDTTVLNLDGCQPELREKDKRIRELEAELENALKEVESFKESLLSLVYQ